MRPVGRFHSFHRGFGFGWYPYRYPYPYYGYYSNYVFGSSESAYDQGQRDGLKTGENDARRNQITTLNDRIISVTQALETTPEITEMVF